MQAIKLELIELTKDAEVRLDEVFAVCAKLKRKISEISNNEDESDKNLDVEIAGTCFDLGKNLDLQFTDVPSFEKYDTRQKYIAERFFQFSRNQWNAQEIFWWCCQNGELAIAKWWYGKHEGSICIVDRDDLALRIACRNRHLQFVKWLVTLDHFSRDRLLNVQSHVFGGGKTGAICEWLTETIEIASKK